MPTVLRVGPYRFHFYSDEGREPPHVHVATADGECKFWLDPIRLARNKGIHPITVRNMEKLVFENLTLLKEKYYEIHGL
jgi:hypothetical protein